MVGGGAVGVGHRGGQLRHLPQPHHGPVHRVPGEPGMQRVKHRGTGLERERKALDSHHGHV